uniref:Uncharacterized protein n=1 Tax=Glossina pallidipes TaxID=7398 RepID=A0A1A9ZSF0_GLOPL
MDFLNEQNRQAGLDNNQNLIFHVLQIGGCHRRLIDINDRSVAFAQKANETECHNKWFDDTISNETNRYQEGQGSPNIRKSSRQSVDDSGSSSNGKSPSIRKDVLAN